MLSETWSLIVNQSDFFTDLMIQHLEISLISVVFAIIIGLGLGIFISEYPKNKWVLAIVNLIYTLEFELLMTGLLKLQREWAVLICKFY